MLLVLKYRCKVRIKALFVRYDALHLCEHKSHANVDIIAHLTVKDVEENDRSLVGKRREIYILEKMSDSEEEQGKQTTKKQEDKQT